MKQDVLKTPSIDSEKLPMIVIFYPVVLAVVAMAINLLSFSNISLELSLPSVSLTKIYVITAALMLINHLWVMTTTEIVRTRYRIWATPEEWDKAGDDPGAIDHIGRRELQRQHNAHRNSTENSVIFLFIAIPFFYLALQ